MSVSLLPLLNMKKVILAAVVAASFAAPQAFAQAKNFEGFSVAGGLNVATSKLENTTVNSMSGTSTNGVLEAQYAAALGEKFVLAGGVSLGLGDSMIGTYNGKDVKLQDASSIYVKPGYAVSNDIAVYGKVSAVSATATYPGAQSLNLSGIGYGVGVQVLSGKNVFYQVEYLQTKFDDKLVGTTLNKVDSSAVSFAIGYKF
jgi:outer membrane immunogenic protein